MCTSNLITAHSLCDMIDTRELVTVDSTDATCSSELKIIVTCTEFGRSSKVVFQYYLENIDHFGLHTPCACMCIYLRTYVNTHMMYKMLSVHCTCIYKFIYVEGHTIKFITRKHIITNFEIVLSNGNMQLDKAAIIYNNWKIFQWKLMISQKQTTLRLLLFPC